jgi:hypothetical protein
MGHEQRMPGRASMMEDELFRALSANTALNAIVSGRIYPVILKEGSTFPALTYQRISSPAETSLDGPSGLSNPRVQITCWADNFSGTNGALAVRNAVKAALAPSRSASIQATRLLDERQTFESDPELYRVDLDFEVWVAE